MNWGDLKLLATSFLHRSDIDFDALSPLARDDINLTLVVQENEATASMTLAQGARQLFFAPLPQDYATMRSAMINGVICEPRDIKTLNERGYSGRNWYSVTGMNIYAPLSGQAEIVYTARLTPFASDAATDQVLLRYSQVWLYALLKHAAILSQDFDARDQYEKQFLDICGTANAVYQNMAFGPGMAAIPVGGPI